MAENYEPGKWDAVVCNGFAAVNVLSSTNVEELGWDYTEMELDPLHLFLRHQVALHQVFH